MFVAVANTPENVIQGPVSVQSAQIKDSSTVAVEENKADITSATSNKDIARIVKEYYKDTPVMANIARCESEYRQFSSDGKVLRGRVNGADVGVMQINEKYHLAASKKLGMDIHTLEGNLQYGAYLYKNEGTRPWNASRPCWGATKQVAAVSTGVEPFVAVATQ